MTGLLSGPWRQKYRRYGLNGNIIGAQKPKTERKMPLNSLDEMQLDSYGSTNYQIILQCILYIYIHMHVYIYIL